MTENFAFPSTVVVEPFRYNAPVSQRMSHSKFNTTCCLMSIRCLDFEVTQYKKIPRHTALHMRSLCYRHCCVLDWASTPCFFLMQYSGVGGADESRSIDNRVPTRIETQSPRDRTQIEIDQTPWEPIRKHSTRANDNLCKCLMYHAACKVKFQPFTRSYSQLTFFNFS